VVSKRCYPNTEGRLAWRQLSSKERVKAHPLIISSFLLYLLFIEEKVGETEQIRVYISIQFNGPLMITVMCYSAIYSIAASVNRKHDAIAVYCLKR
jgi:hypothetical protein